MDVVRGVGASHLAVARSVLAVEAEALSAVADRLDARFDVAVNLVSSCVGRVILTGIGKSGIVGRKIAATLSSVGTPSFFLHPVEALHGDLGMVRAGDVVIAVSYSGETPEILALVTALRAFDARLIALTGTAQSSLRRHADAVLEAYVPSEACPLNLLPTASTTAALALGDALAIAVMTARGVTRADVAKVHPNGRVGALTRREGAVA